MDEQNIIEMLSLVGEELQEMGLKRPVRILLVGGAYMVTQIHNRSVTRDVDIIAQKISQDSEEYRLLKEAARFIAQDLKASPAWLSDNMAQFFQSIGKVPNGKLWLSKGKLEVYLPDPGYVLVLKMISARDKDLEDLEALFQTLGIKKRKQAENLVKKYLNQTTQEEYSREIQIALDSFSSNPIPWKSPPLFVTIEVRRHVLCISIYCKPYAYHFRKSVRVRDPGQL